MKCNSRVVQLHLMYLSQFVQVMKTHAQNVEGCGGSDVLSVVPVVNPFTSLQLKQELPFHVHLNALVLKGEPSPSIHM